MDVFTTALSLSDTSCHGITAPGKKRGSDTEFRASFTLFSPTVCQRLLDLRGEPCFPVCVRSRSPWRRPQPRAARPRVTYPFRTASPMAAAIDSAAAHPSQPWQPPSHRSPQSHRPRRAIRRTESTARAPMAIRMTMVGPLRMSSCMANPLRSCRSDRRRADFRGTKRREAHGGKRTFRRCRPLSSARPRLAWRQGGTAGRACPRPRQRPGP